MSEPEQPPPLVPLSPILQLPLASPSLSRSDPMADQPSPPSSSGSNKRLADTDISELVRKAKASRYNNQLPKQNDDEIANNFERDLSCAICSEVQAHPVVCLDCLHSFCGSCLVPWFERSDTCPTCRRTVKGTKDNYTNVSLIETLLNHYPDKKRDPDELKELELIYKPGQKINITNTYSDEDDEQDPEEEDEDNSITWNPCPCCIQPNTHGFNCPDPIPPPDPVRGPHRSNVYSFRSHLNCQYCPSAFPTAWKPGWKCENCGTISCSNLFQCSAPGFLKTTADQITNPTDNAYINGLAITTYFYDNAAELANFVNPTEFNIFHAWMTTHNLTWRDVGQRIYDFTLAKHGNQIPFSRVNLSPADFVCQPCMTNALRSKFMSWWIYERENTGFVDNRVKCWYGRKCRTQVRGLDHATRLIHACDEIPATQRRNDAPPRAGAPVVWVPGDGIRVGGGAVSVVGNGVAVIGGSNDGDRGAVDNGGGVGDGNGDGGGGGDESIDFLETL